MQTDWQLPKTLTLDAGGAYCWKYDMKANHNSDSFRFMMKVLLWIAVPIAVAMLAATWPYNHALSLLSVACFLVLMLALPALVWKLMPPNPGYRMDERTIEAWPKSKGQNRIALSSVRRVTLCPARDLIKLRVPLGSVRVYVPKDDYPFVQAFIAAYVPEKAEIISE